MNPKSLHCIILIILLQKFKFYFGTYIFKYLVFRKIAQKKSAGRAVAYDNAADKNLSLACFSLFPPFFAFGGLIGSYCYSPPCFRVIVSLSFIPSENTVNFFNFTHFLLKFESVFKFYYSKRDPKPVT